MNLFCFTLEGSSESMYEPAYSRTVREARPKYQCSPALLRRRPEWGGSDPAINSSKMQTVKTRRHNVKSCFVTPTLDKETIDIHRACWVSSDDKKDLAHQKKVSDKDVCETSKDTGNILGMDHERKHADPTTQASETAADTAESIKARRLKKLQNLVPTKKGGQQSASGKERGLSENYDHLTDVLSSYNPVLTCIGLGKREKNPPVTSPSPVRSRSASREPSEVESLLSPLASPCEPWSPLHCHESGHVFGHETWESGSALSLPRTAAWDRFESLIQELDRKQPDSCLPQMVRSITDLDLHQDELTRFGRFDAFRQQWPLMIVQDNGNSCTKQTNAGEDLNETRSQKETELTPCEDSKAVKTGDTTSITIKESGRGGELTKGHCNSLESLYSSGQSSSSGVTSGSNCSSNRTSLRLDDDVSSPRHFCGRARVHTEFVPNPYDTESLKLKVGDVIDIISKPAMGTWTGLLNNKIGYFKFIYVDLLKDESSDFSESTTGDTCVQELLKRFDLEGYALTLVLHGYQTAEDLVKLRERHLIELNVTDPEHRQRLLSAVSTLPPPHPAQGKGAEEVVYENVRSGPRDSGCGMVSPDSITELPSPTEHSPADVVTAS